MIPVIMKGTPQGMIVIYNDGSQKEVAQRPEKYLEEACLKHGSTMEGREQAFRYLTDSLQKAAVLVNEEKHELWFPTVSKSCENCEWIAYYNLLKVCRRQENTSEIIFDNGFRAVVNCSIRTMNLQRKRCQAFLTKICQNS